MNASLISSNLKGANLKDSNLKGANLKDSNLTKTILLGTTFPENLDNIKGVNFDGAVYDHKTKFPKGFSIEKYDIYCICKNSNLEDANLSNFPLNGADLSGAILSNVKFTNANLSSADLSKAILLSTDFRKAKNFIPTQLKSKKPPLICNSPLPQSIKINPNRDCDKLPPALYKRYPKRFSSLEKAKKFVQDQRQKKWN